MANTNEKWVEEQAALTKPNRIHWVQCTEDEIRRLIEIGIRVEMTGPHRTFRELNHDAFPNSYLHIIIEEVFSFYSPDYDLMQYPCRIESGCIWPMFTLSQRMAIVN